jgi:cytochrome c oxidase assembly protein subunit 15
VVVKQNLWLHRFAWVTAAWAFFVIFAGGMVTSTHSGMAVPDWPQSFGTWTPKMVGGVFYEHGHRMVAGMVGVFTIVLALWSAFVEKRLKARLLSWLALAAVVLQALFGGLTVLLGTYYGWDHTSPLVSSMHASLAQLFFSIVVSFAVVTAPGWLARPQTERRIIPATWPLLGVATVLAVYLQIILGAVLRHQEAGLIIPDFPLSYGHLIPLAELQDGRVALAFSHRSFAYLVVALALTLAEKVLRGSDERWLRMPALLLAAAVLLQASLGAFSIWTGLKPVVTALHVIGGSLVLASSLALTLRLFKVRGPGRA